MPPINLSLWGSLFGSLSYSFKYIQNINDLVEGARTVSLKLPSRDIFKNANELWKSLVYEKIKFFFTSIDSAQKYLFFQPIIDEWLAYYDEFPTRELDVLREKMLFQPWYAEVLKTIPHMNQRGLILIELPSIGRYALYDYYPELNRSFVCRKDERFEYLWQVEPCVEHSGHVPLPRDKSKHLHLLPQNENADFPILVEHVQCAYFYDERWLGNDYAWDRSDTMSEGDC